MVFDKIKEILVDEIGCEEADVTPEANVIDDLGADSLAVMQIAMEIEDEYGITIPEEEIPNFKTVNDIVSFVENNK